MDNYDGKMERLKNRIVEFDRSHRGKGDYMNLFLDVHRMLKQGSGLTWVEVEKAIDWALRELG